MTIQIDSPYIWSGFLFPNLLGRYSEFWNWVCSWRCSGASGWIVLFGQSERKVTLIWRVTFPWRLHNRMSCALWTTSHYPQSAWTSIPWFLTRAQYNCRQAVGLSDNENCPIVDSDRMVFTIVFDFFQHDFHILSGCVLQLCKAAASMARLDEKSLSCIFNSDFAWKASYSRFNSFFFF